MTQSRDQQLLVKLYECEELILNICKNDIKDEKYIVISEIITYLEKKIMHEQGFVGL
tara:strand:+ start:273 stop:443 length:171 start_codon:yes stop_codon:yes gene_type:complete